MKSGSCRSMHPCDRELHRKYRAVRAQRAELEPPRQNLRCAAGPQAGQPGAMRGPQVGRDDRVRHVQPHDRITRVAKHPLRRRVEVDDVSLDVHRDDRIERGVYDGAIRFFRLVKIVFEPAPLQKQTEPMAQRLRKPQEVGISRKRARGEELHHGAHGPVDQHRKGEAAFEMGGLFPPQAGKVQAIDHVTEPDRLALAPDRTGKALAVGEPVVVRAQCELVNGGVGVSCQPRLIADDRPGVGADGPEAGVRRAEHKAEAREQTVDGFIRVPRAGEDVGEGELRLGAARSLHRVSLVFDRQQHVRERLGRKRREMRDHIAARPALVRRRRVVEHARQRDGGARERGFDLR